MYCQYGWFSLTFRALALRQSGENNYRLYYPYWQYTKPFYISICISTLPTQHTPFISNMATDAMFIVRQMMERKLEFQQESSWGFLDLDKAYDKINREMIPPVLRQYHVPEELITMAMALYRTPRTQVRTCFGKTKTFEVKVGLHQGTTLSPLLFIILLDYISRRAQWSEDRRLFMLMTSYWEPIQQRNYNKQ